MPRGEDLVNSDSPRAKGVILSSSDFAALMDELESLRARVHADGQPQSRNEDPNASVAERTAGLLAALERAEIDPARIAEVAAAIELASALDDVATVGYRVGYDSTSQFSREYRRQFGLPPRRDAARVRARR